MNKLLLLSTALAALVGCRNHYQGEIVKETYEHKYGVPISGSDWLKQGRDGKIIQLMKDGVTVSHSYDHGVLDGISSWSFPNSSTIHYEEEYAQGKLICRRENSMSGTPSKEEAYDVGGMVQRKMSWYEDGTPSSVEHYEKGLLVTGEYRTPLNTIDSKVQRGEGKRLVRDADGELVAEDEIVGGRLIKRKEFYPNGDPLAITSFQDGVIHGERVTFLKGGLPNTIEQWVEGVQEGLTTVYLNGERFATVPYKEGKKHGIELRYRDGSLLVEEISWLDDVQHGPHKIYVDGATKLEWYHQGNVVSRPTYERLNPSYGSV